MSMDGVDDKDVAEARTKPQLVYPLGEPPEAGVAHEIAPGQALPGLGKVQAIEKRGKAWIVVTDKGFIGAEPR